MREGADMCNACREHTFFSNVHGDEPPVFRNRCHLFSYRGGHIQDYRAKVRLGSKVVGAFEADQVAVRRKQTRSSSAHGYSIRVTAKAMSIDRPRFFSQALHTSNLWEGSAD